MVGRGWAGAGAGGWHQFAGLWTERMARVTRRCARQARRPGAIFGRAWGYEAQEGGVTHKGSHKGEGLAWLEFGGPCNPPWGLWVGQIGAEAQVMEGGRPAFGALCIPTSQVPPLTMKLPGVPAWIQRQHLAQSRDPPDRSALCDRQERAGDPHVLILGPPLCGPRAQATRDHAPEYQPP